MTSERRTHREESLDEAAAARAVAAEGALAPQHRESQGTFGGVVGRLKPVDVHEGEERVVMSMDLLAHAADLPARQTLALFEQRHNGASDRLHRHLEGRAAEGAVADPVPQAEQPARFAQQPLPEAFGVRAMVEEGLEVALEVAPAKLTSARREPAIRRPSIAGHDATKPLPEQFLGYGGAATRPDHEHRDEPRDHDPEPGFALVLAPARLVGVRAVVRLRVAEGFLERRRQRAAHLLLRLGHHPRGHRHVQHLRHDGAGLPHALLELAAQQPRHGLHRGGVGAGGDPWRQRRGRHFAAVGAAHVKALMIRHERLDIGQLVDVVVDAGAGQLSLRKVGLAVLAFRAPVLKHPVHVLGHRGEVRLVTRLTAALAPLGPFALRSHWPCRVRGWRLGRVLRVLRKPRAKLDDLSTRRSQLGLSQRQLLLDRRDQREQFLVCRWRRDLPIEILSPPVSSTKRVNGYERESVAALLRGRDGGALRRVTRGSYIHLP